MPGRLAVRRPCCACLSDGHTGLPTPRGGVPMQESMEGQSFASARPEASQRRTSPVLERAADGTQQVRDIAYGSDPEQRLDIYMPEARAAAPLLIFVHGG